MNEQNSGFTFVLVDDTQKKQSQKKLTVLLVEDHASTLAMYEATVKEALGKDTEVLKVTTVKEAERVFKKHARQITLVVMDGCLNGTHTLDTLPLIATMKERASHIPIIAACNIAHHREEMMCAGCDYELKRKSDLPDVLVSSLLGL